MRATTWVMVVSVLAIAPSGCASTSAARPAAERAMMTDGDWYREAIEEALRTYERAVFTGTQSYDPRCFDEMLAVSLAERGLTPRGLDVYTEHHAELAAYLENDVRPRLDRVRRNDPAIATCTLGTDAPQATALYSPRTRSDI